MAEAKDRDIMEVRYDYTGEYLVSYGELSKFFKEVLVNKKLHGTKCPQCGRVWMPPRKYCSDCYVTTEWVPLSGNGTMLSCTWGFYASTQAKEKEAYEDVPFLLGVIKLDEADTCFLHRIMARDRRIGAIQPGTRVKVQWKEKREGTVADFYFVPEGE